MKWGIDLGRFDEEASGKMAWIMFAGVLPAAFCTLVGGAIVIHNWGDTEGVEMLVGGACALAAIIGLTVAGYRRQLIWALGIGWAGLLAYAALLDYGPRMWSVIRGIPFLIGGVFVFGWELLTSITRLEWIFLIAAWLVLRALARLSRQIQTLIELALADRR